MVTTNASLGHTPPAPEPAPEGVTRVVMLARISGTRNGVDWPDVGGAVTVGAGREWGLSLATPVIVKYRDERTDARTELERWIR